MVVDWTEDEPLVDKLTCLFCALAKAASISAADAVDNARNARNRRVFHQYILKKFMCVEMDLMARMKW